MAESKKNYWIKVNEHFFEDDTIDEICEQKDGSKYLIVYFRMLLKSLRYDGYLAKVVGDETIPLNSKRISEFTKMPIKTVEEAIQLLKKYNLIEIYDKGLIHMKRLEEMVGKESEHAAVKRAQREKQKILKLKDNVQDNVQDVSEECPYYKEKEQELELDLEKEIKKAMQDIGENYDE